MNLSKTSIAISVLVLGVAVLLVVTLSSSRNSSVRSTDAYNSIANDNNADTLETSEASGSPSSTNTSMEKSLPKPKMEIYEKKKYEAILKTTEGDITIEFDTLNAPITSNNFIYLARNRFYDNVVFHRVLPGFMIQGGDPEGTGSGGPGYSFNDEYLEGSYTRGTLAMANAGPNTNGSQFFIMHADYPLPNAYVIFGHVTSGLEVVDKIATAETTVAFGGEKSKPVKPVKITSVEVIEK